MRSGKTSRRTSISLIEKSVNENWINQLAFFHILKYHFNNSCIYNYRSRMSELSIILNISEKTLYNYLKALRSKDLIFDREDNLIIRSIRELRKRKKIIIEVDAEHRIWDVTCLLYGKLIEQKAKQQAFAESVRRFGRGDKFKSGLSANPFRPSFSYLNIAKLLKVSKSKAVRVIKTLEKLEVIRTEKQKSQMISDNFQGLKYVEDYLGYRYNIGTKLFEIFGTRFEFLQFPIYLKKVSLKRYINHIRL